MTNTDNAPPPSQLPPLYTPRLDFFGQQLLRCPGCPHGYAKLVGGKGDKEAKIVIVGESPGTEEVKQGIPFVGPTGAVLAHAIDPHQIRPLYLNAFQCFPGSVKTKTQDKTSEATRCCAERLRREILEHPRDIILALGNNAVWSLTNDYTHKITQIRGKIFPSPLSRYGIVAAVHPAYLLRGGGSMRQFIADVDFAIRVAKDGGENPKRYIIPQVHVAKSVENVVWLSQEVARHKFVAADIETGGYSGFDHLRDRILCCGLSWDPHHVYVVPEAWIGQLHLIFRAKSTRFVWHNGKFDTKFLWANGARNCRVDEDTMLLSYALDETKGLHDLEQIAGDLLGAPDWKYLIKEYTTGTKKAPKTYADIPANILYDYMAKDVSGTLQVFNILRKYVASDPHLEKLYTKTLIPMSEYMARIEMNGMQPDLEQVKVNAAEMGKKEVALELEFQRHAVAAGISACNPRSPVQVGPFLYDVLGLRDPRKPKRRPESTDEDTLLTLPKHPAVKVLLDYREVQKGLSTYVNSIPEHVGADGRIHTSYLIHGTTTGRPASRKPNILNIPRDPKLRGQFKAGTNSIYMEIDVNQAELRVLAELSHDEVLTHIYTTPGAPSIHLVTQTEMFGDPAQYDDSTWNFWEEKFSSQGDRKRTLNEQNMAAKAVNFGIVYGRTAGGIAEEFKIPTKDAQEWIDKWFAKYAGAREYLLLCRKAPLTGQSLVTPFGRKRRFQIVNRERLTDIQNQASNFFPQSIAVDCVTHTGMAVQNFALRDYGAALVNTVYDSLLFELPNDIPKALELGYIVLCALKETPKAWGLNRIPFVGDLKIGERWGNLEKTPIPEEVKEKAKAKLNKLGWNLK